MRFDSVAFAAFERLDGKGFIPLCSPTIQPLLDAAQAARLSGSVSVGNKDFPVKSGVVISPGAVLGAAYAFDETQPAADARAQAKAKAEADAQAKASK